MLENSRWLLYASRFYGCHPHAIRERADAADFRPRALYSLLACCVYCCSTYYSNDIIPCVSKSVMIVGCFLLQIQRFSRALYMILTPLLSCCRRTEFECAAAAARKYDSATQRYRSDKGNSNGRTQWTVVLTIHLGWAVFGVLAKTSLSSVLWRIIFVQCLMRAAFSVEVAKFCFLYGALYSRFRHLNGLCSKRTDLTVGFYIEIPRAYVADNLTVCNIQRLHRCLTDAANNLSSYYSPQLLCWMACMLMDIVTYSFFTIYAVYPPQVVCVQCIFLLYLSLQLIVISRICDLTCDQANALARTVLSTEATLFKDNELSVETIELGVHLRAHPLCVKVAGLFNLDSKFIFSAFGIILMYIILASSIK